VIKEFAVDPETLARWDDCRYILALFSAGSGRVIANFPKKWKRDAFVAARNAATPMERKRIEERLRRLDNTVLLSRKRPAGNNDNWLENALQEHERLPFTSIISKESEDNVIAVDDIDEASVPFLVPRGISVDRTAEAMADAVSMMFEAGNHFKFIDPYFSSTQTYMQPMQAFIERISRRAAGVENIVIELICKDEGNTEANRRFRHNVSFEINKFLPDQMELRVSLFPDHLIHDRWILAEWVGIKFGHGFGTGGDNPSVNLDLLDESTRKRHWDEFTQGD